MAVHLHKRNLEPEMVIHEVGGELFNVVSCRVVGTTAVSPKARNGRLLFWVGAFLIEVVRNTFRVQSWSEICQVIEVNMIYELGRGIEGGMTVAPHTFKLEGCKEL